MNFYKKKKTKDRDPFPEGEHQNGSSVASLEYVYMLQGMCEKRTSKTYPAIKHPKHKKKIRTLKKNQQVL